MFPLSFIKIFYLDIDWCILEKNDKYNYVCRKSVGGLIVELITLQ
jgi:hypothetical protein